jgi:predicted phage-related endonuclease
MTLSIIPKPTHGSLEWLNVRRRDEKGQIIFGASEAPILMGESKYQNVVDLAISKWQPAEVKKANEAMQRGNYLEASLISYGSDLLGHTFITPNVMFRNGRMIATLDGINESQDIILEAKTTTAYSSDDELPREYFWQGVAQLACVPTAHKVVFVVLDKFMRLGSWTLMRDEKAIALLMLQAEEIGAMLDERKLPDYVSLTEKQAKELYRNPAGEKELGVNALHLVEVWSATRDARMMAEKEEQLAKDALANLIGEAEYGTINGDRVISFKPRKGSTRVDTKMMEIENPDLVAKYKTTGDSTRVLRLMGDK